MITALGVAELKMLLRNRTAAALAFAMPLAMGVWFATSLGAEAWPVAITLQLLGSMGFTAYVTITTSLTSRRQDLYLKRLRTGAASDAVVLTGVVLPPVLLALVQVVLLLGVSLAAGAPLPQRPELVLLAVVGGVAMSAAAGVATSGITSTAELAQITTGPFFLALFAGGVWAANTSDPRALAVPGGGVADLVRVAWGGDGRPELAALSLLGWTALGCVASLRLFRWDARD
ncbi:ABC transporter permease [Actinosynnema sp. NPDC047251]|uniref:Putative secreted protein n=1 Tax=Saccharothrix espanaensis (strain ATCC 51144 / DSM 44229 / JCM 9112 / NBRC 15066 / NRRL 15764) TaxID=1179773 RepID=K0K040_SACES|nr:ABC transporter permease [Saccharothrix espanaensis]CCH29923.1 putative secreted protein [Saccharothrix espanaensis DSM 44229]